MFVSFLLLLFFVSFCLFKIALRKIAYSVLTIAGVLMIAAGCGGLPRLLMHNLQADYQSMPRVDWQQPTWIILLAAGAIEVPVTQQVLPSIMSYGRIAMAAKLFKACQAAGGDCTIIGSGTEHALTGMSEGQSYQAELIALGIPQSAIQLVSGSFNTHQEARYCQRLVLPGAARQLLLVTSAFHLRRAVKNFSGLGLTVVPIAADYLKPAYTFLPSGSNFAMMDLAVHEYLGYFTVSLADNRAYQWLAKNR